MSVNWVMIAENGGYTPLPGETTLFQSPQRTTLSLQSSHGLPQSQAYSQQCKSGVVYLTNRRIIYLPVTPTPTFQSFAVPILNVADSRVTAPWFGANKWEAAVHPVVGGGIPPHHSELDCVMEFKDGGAFDFHNTLERLKERLRQTIDVARESGIDETVAAGNVITEDLPAYEDSRQHTRVPEAPRSPPINGGPSAADTGAGAGGPVTVVAPEADSPQRSSPLQSPQPFQPPSEPPPGYEEVQRSSIADELERRLSDPHWDDELRK